MVLFWVVLFLGGGFVWGDGFVWGVPHVVFGGHVAGLGGGVGSLRAHLFMQTPGPQRALRVPRLCVAAHLRTDVLHVLRLLQLTCKIMIKECHVLGPVHTGYLHRNV